MHPRDVQLDSRREPYGGLVTRTTRPLPVVVMILCALGSVVACGGGTAAPRALPKATAIPAIPATTTATTGTGAPAATATAAKTTTSGVATTGSAAGTTVAPPSTTSAPATGALRAVRGRTIVIDPGHNGANFSHPSQINQTVFVGNGSKACDTTGTTTNDGYTEAAYNFDVATRLTALLRAAGATVIMTRPDNNGVGPCVTERASIGNRAHADAAISIHADGGPSGGRGFHVIQPAAVAGFNTAIVPPSVRLALAVRRDYQATTGMPFATYLAAGSGLETRSDLGGLNLSTVPKVFIETGNMRSATDAVLLETPAFRQKVAVGVAQAFADFLAGS
jgi:N-acetylmuramoyl-L-alanine amidase